MQLPLPTTIFWIMVKEGIISTIEACKKENIHFTGAGRNIEEASEPLIQEVNGFRIAIVNFCENEWSVATGSSWGANPMNIIDNVQQIKSGPEASRFCFGNHPWRT
jgi:hypothetical protein